MAASNSIESMLTDADKERIIKHFRVTDIDTTDSKTITMLYKLLVCEDLDIAIQGLNKSIMMQEAQVVSDESPAQKAYKEERIKKLRESIETLKMCVDDMGWASGSFERVMHRTILELTAMSNKRSACTCL